jgi:hypothetical protein
MQVTVFPLQLNECNILGGKEVSHIFYILLKNFILPLEEREEEEIHSNWSKTWICNDNLKFTTVSIHPFV